MAVSDELVPTVHWLRTVVAYLLHLGRQESVGRDRTVQQQWRCQG